MRSLQHDRFKWSYVTRTMPEVPFSVGPPPTAPRSGDLVVARVDRLGVHDHAEDRYGRRMRLYPGDLLVGALGNRYATDFYEGYVPTGTRTHLLTAGGLVGTVAAAHDAHGEPTSLEVIGSLIEPDGVPLTTDTFALTTPPPCSPPVGTFVVVGSGMNSGKTTTVDSVVRGWSAAGFRVGAGKVTGSGSGKDRWSYIDAGASDVTDFLEFGMPSTFGYPGARLAATMVAIRDRLAGLGAEVVVLEIADGLLQSDTSALLDAAGRLADGVVFAAVDALSARSGLALLRERGIEARAVSGLVSRSPLASREAADATGLPVLTAAELAAGAAVELLAPVGAA